jgi:hypothetical protein
MLTNQSWLNVFFIVVASFQIAIAFLLNTCAVHLAEAVAELKELSSHAKDASEVHVGISDRLHDIANVHADLNDRVHDIAHRLDREGTMIKATEEAAAKIVYAVEEAKGEVADLRVWLELNKPDNEPYDD